MVYFQGIFSAITHGNNVAFPTHIQSSLVYLANTPETTCISLHAFMEDLPYLWPIFMETTLFPSHIYGRFGIFLAGIQIHDIHTCMHLLLGNRGMGVGQKLSTRIVKLLTDGRSCVWWIYTMSCFTCNIINICVPHPSKANVTKSKCMLCT